MKANIVQLKIDMVEAKTRQAEATKEAKRIEKDMKEFSSNKDDKLAELQTSLEALKKGLTKNSIAVKTLQKDVQNSRLDSEQAGSDLSAAEEQLAEADSTLRSQKEEIVALQKEQAQAQVGVKKPRLMPILTSSREPMTLLKLNSPTSKPS